MIHDSAVIDSDAELGSDVSVGPFSYIQSGTKIGDGCIIGPNATILKYSELGPGCVVHAGAVVGDTPQDLAFTDVPTYARIGARTTLREGVTIHRGTKEGTATVLGEDCYLMACSHCAHNVKLGNKVILANNVMLGGYVEVGDGVFMGGGAGVHQFCKIGRLAMIGGNSGMGKDVPPFCMIKTQSFNSIAGLNVVGLRRAGFSPDERKEIKRAFNMLYRSGLNVKQAVEKMKKEFSSGPAREFVDFIEASDRGLCYLDRESYAAPKEGDSA